MERRFKRQLAGMLVVLGLGIFPAMAQFPGGGPLFPGSSSLLLGTSSPEVAKKLSSISTLREILRLKLTNQDISTALPSLKALRDDETSLQKESLDLLTEEENALIAAQPGGQLPPESGARLQELRDRHHTAQEKGWSLLVKSLGQEKTDGIRGFVGQEAPRPPAPGGPAGFGAAPQGLPGGGFPGAGFPLGQAPGGRPAPLPPFLRGDNRPGGGIPFPFMRNRVSLSELIEAMELKVGATK